MTSITSSMSIAPQFGVMGRLAEGALYHTVHATDKDVQQHWPQYLETIIWITFTGDQIFFKYTFFSSGRKLSSLKTSGELHSELTAKIQ